ncbi:MAG TPA: DUF4167 domain-containing protein [Xanthobacteraceae bacterium]|nr:DUF4167 domain-containing protein [Xanthobacteraceae bacterium]
MRNGQNKRMRGRNRKGGHHQNPLSRMYESNGPDVKIRGTASHVAEKYLQLARDAQSSGDPVAAENYYQHAEHYFRLIAAAQEQFRQSQPYYQQSGEPRGNFPDDGYDDGDSEQPSIGGEPFAPREPQPFYPREQQQPPPQPQHAQPRPQNLPPAPDEDVERLPSFITGGGQPHQQAPQQPPQQGQGPNGPNGPNGYDGSADRFPLHRRRRRHRGPRDHSMPSEGDAPMPAGPRPIDD